MTIHGLWLAISMLGTPAATAQSTNTERDDVVYTCTTCHGSDGRGNRVVRAPGIDGREGWYIRRQLENFRDGVRGTHDSYISGLEMRAAASMLNDTDIDRILRAIEGWRPVPTHEGLDGDRENGQEIYSTNCVACHGRGAEGIEAVGAPSLADRSDWYLMNQLRLFKSGYRGTHPDDRSGAQMRAMTSGLDVETDMRDVVAYLRTIGETGRD